MIRLSGVAGSKVSGPAMGVAATTARAAAMRRHQGVARATWCTDNIQRGAPAMLSLTWRTAAAIPRANQSRKPGSQ